MARVLKDSFRTCYLLIEKGRKYIIFSAFFDSYICIQIE